MYVKVSGIYRITNLINNKVYIGQSLSVRKRLSNHKGKLRLGAHCNSHLQLSWNKYGEGNFSFTLLEGCSREELDSREAHWINFYNSLDRDHGYNNILPGTYEYKNNRIRKPRLGKPRDIIYVNLTTKEVQEFKTVKEVRDKLNLCPQKVNEILRYWIEDGAISRPRKSHKKQVVMDKSIFDRLGLDEVLKRATTRIDRR